MKRLLRIFKKLVFNPFLIFHYIFRGLSFVLVQLPYFRFIRNTKGSETEITLLIWFLQKVVGINGTAYWPMHHASIVSYAKNVCAGIDTCPGYNPGCYIHAVNKIYIGDYTQIGPNVGLMSGNHSLYDFRIQSVDTPIVIGRHSWIGMGAIILPGVELGDFTIVGAGAIVTKSFPEGYCVLVGNPARKIENLDKDKCKFFTTQSQYNGYIPHEKFEEYRVKNLNV